jgi:hypothetical protein
MGLLSAPCELLGPANAASELRREAGGPWLSCISRKCRCVARFDAVRGVLWFLMRLRGLGAHLLRQFVARGQPQSDCAADWALERHNLFQLFKSHEAAKRYSRSHVHHAHQAVTASFGQSDAFGRRRGVMASSSGPIPNAMLSAFIISNGAGSSGKADEETDHSVMIDHSLLDLSLHA